MPEKYQEQVIKHAGMTYTATAWYTLQSELCKINQTNWKKGSSHFFPLIVWASICANAQRTRLGEWLPKIIRDFFIWISSPVWFTITQHKSLNQHSMGHIGWWQAALFQHQLSFNVHQSTAYVAAQCLGIVLSLKEHTALPKNISQELRIKFLETSDLF